MIFDVVEVISLFKIKIALKEFEIVDVNLAQPPFHYVHAPLQIMKRIPIPQSAVHSKRDARTGEVFHGSSGGSGSGKAKL